MWRANLTERPVRFVNLWTRIKFNLPPEIYVTHRFFISFHKKTSVFPWNLVHKMRIWNFSPHIHETCIFPKIQAWNEIRIPALPPSYLSLGSFNFSTKNFMYRILHYYTLATTLTNNGRSTVSNSLIKNVTRSSLTFSKFIIQATRGGTVNTAAKLQNTVSSTDSATAPPACAVCWRKNCISKT